MGILPPGDIRNCLVALANTETLMDRVFQHRFQSGEGLKGHTLGNLLLAAMTEITGDFMKAVVEVSKILAVRGRVLPATLQPVVLKALMSDGQTVFGETAIRSYPGAISEMCLCPDNVKPLPDAVEAIHEADLVVLGPGSLYTSVLPHLMVREIRDALRESRAIKAYVCNIMTEHGETDGYRAEDHVAAINKYAEGHLLDCVIVNSRPIDQEVAGRYAQEKAHPVIYDAMALANMGIKVIEADLLAEERLAWHEAGRLSRILMKLIQGEEQ
jgi:uncharacterized cofD-like protein